MQLKKQGVAVLLGAAAFMSAAPGSATSLRKLSFEEMVADSAVIVQGVVDSSVSKQTEGGVFTTTKVYVSDAIVGNVGSVVEVVAPGGVFTSGKFKLAETYPGAPRFISGGEVVLFLESMPAQKGYEVVGFSQGVMPVEETAQGKAVRSLNAPGGKMAVSDLKSRILEIRASKKSGAKSGVRGLAD
ncbi:MAG: hypothetical protein VX640_14220 [Pseudomonadota bacterium]|nr:hypothetical protein [Pseudomonadota bacterium]